MEQNLLIENEEEVIDLDLTDELSDNSQEEDEETPESPDVDLDIKLMETIRNMFDAGSTRSVIAKELGLNREDVIEVLSKYVGRAKINGKNTQVIDFKFDGTGRRRLELGDRCNTSIYISVNATEEEIEAIRKKWLKIINDKND